MKPIFLLFWQICRLKQGPEHVPTQTWFVLLVIVANLLCSLLASTVFAAHHSHQHRRRSDQHGSANLACPAAARAERTLLCHHYRPVRLRPVDHRLLRHSAAFVGFPPMGASTGILTVPHLVHQRDGIYSPPSAWSSTSRRDSGGRWLLYRWPGDKRNRHRDLENRANKPANRQITP